VVRRKYGNSVKLAALLIVMVAALLILKGDINFLRLSVLNVPAEGVSYSFDDNTLQGWVSTSQYITVENGRVKAEASEPGGGTQTYRYTFDADFEGWQNITDTASSHGGYGQAVTEVRDHAAYLKAAYVYILSYPSWAYAWIKKEFDFTGAQSVKASFICISQEAVVKAYKSVGGRQGDFIGSWDIPSYNTWTTVEMDLSQLAGQRVFLYFGVECPEKTVREDETKTLWIDNLEITTTAPVFTTEGYIEKEFSFTKGFKTATIKAINLQVDYASEAEWTGFWGVKILESGIEKASFQFTKGYMAWNTFTQERSHHKHSQMVYGQRPLRIRA